MEPLFSGTIAGFKIGPLIAAIIGGILRVVLRRKDGVLNNVIGFSVGLTVSLLCTDVAAQVIANKAGVGTTDGLHTAVSAALALVGNDLCIALIRYVKVKTP